MRSPTFTAAFAITLTLACSGPGSDDEAGTAESTGTDDTSDESSTTSDESTSTNGGTSDETSTTSDETTATDGETLDTSDTTGTFDCDTFAQDCPDGEKCVPYASSGGPYDTVKCVPILGDQAPGDSCTYISVEDGTDDCDGTSWCLQDTCSALCAGTPEMPECPPMSVCSSLTEGVIYVCTPTCDPLGQNCDQGSACYWYMEAFSCLPTSDDIPTGQPCGFPNDCAAGNYCITNAKLPTCGAAECCANFCDLGLGDSQCAGVPGTACVPFFDEVEAMVIPGDENLGICVLPP